MERNPYMIPFQPGDRVFVEHEGLGTVTAIDCSSVYVRCDSDGVEVAAAPEQTFRPEDRA